MTEKNRFKMQSAGSQSSKSAAKEKEKQDMLYRKQWMKIFCSIKSTALYLAGILKDKTLAYLDFAYNNDIVYWLTL